MIIIVITTLIITSINWRESKIRRARFRDPVKNRSDRLREINKKKEIISPPAPFHPTPSPAWKKHSTVGRVSKVEREGISPRRYLDERRVSPDRWEGTSAHWEIGPIGAIDARNPSLYLRSRVEIELVVP